MGSFVRCGYVAMWLLRSVDATDHTCVPYGEVCDQPSANGTPRGGGVVSDWSRGPVWNGQQFLDSCFDTCSSRQYASVTTR